MTISNIQGIDVQTSYEPRKADRRDEQSDNSQLLVPASYAAVGGTFELLMLMLESSKAQKDSARQTIASNESTLAKVQAAQVEDIRSKAGSQLAGALGSAALSVGAAGMQLDASMSELQASDLDRNAAALASNGRLLDAAQSPLSDGAASLRAASQSLHGRAAYATAAGKALDVASGLAKGAFEASATNADASSASKQHQAEALQRSTERLSSELDQLKGNEDKLIAYARDIEAAKTRCTQIALQSR